MGLKDERSPWDFPAFSRGMIVALLHDCGHSPWCRDMLNMFSSSLRARGLSSCRKLGVILSGPWPPLRFIFAQAPCSSVRVKSWQYSELTSWDFILFFRSMLMSLSSFVNLCLHIPAQ